MMIAFIINVNREPGICLARRRAIDIDVAVGGGLWSLRIACFERRVMVGRTLRARRHNVFHNVIE